MEKVQLFSIDNEVIFEHVQPFNSISQTIEKALDCKVELGNIFLEEEEIHDINFYNIDFSKGIFKNSNFKRIVFFNCSFSNETLKHTRFVSCRFNYCTFHSLSKVNFSNTNFQDCTFDKYSITDCDFKICRFSTCDFIKVDFENNNFNLSFENSCLDESTFHNNIYKNIHFKNCSVFETDLREINFYESIIDGTDITNAILKQSFFRISNVDHSGNKTEVFYSPNLDLLITDNFKGTLEELEILLSKEISEIYEFLYYDNFIQFYDEGFLFFLKKLREHEIMLQHKTRRG